MAKIISGNDTNVFQIKRFLGVNETDSGDTRLKLGEAAEMRNWCITSDGSLRIRPGTKTILSFDGAVHGMWYGSVAGQHHFICAAAGKLWHIDGDEATELGEISEGSVFFFGYANKVYAMNGTDYMVWDGDMEHGFEAVAGYIPTIIVASTPAGNGQENEQINKLTAKRIARFSPDGSAMVFYLPEKDIASVDRIESLSGATIAEWSADTEKGTVTFKEAPERGVDNLEIEYTAGADSRESVLSMRFAETYNGNNDNRIFLYGDGSNQAFYSGIDRNGKPTAEYFPDLNILSVGEANTPITGLIRHYSKMLAFKPNSAYTVGYDTIALPDGRVIPGFYVSPTNKTIGNVAMGQVQNVTNNPYTIYANNVYEWKGNSYGNFTLDERQAKLIGQRVKETLTELDLKRAYCFDDDYTQELYIIVDGTAVIHNYSVDAWYIYTNFPATSMVRIDEDLYIGTPYGEIRHVGREHYKDYGKDGEAFVDAFWRSGSMDFSKDWKRKYTSTIWVGMKPEARAKITVTARSNKNSNYPDKSVSYGLSTFEQMDFSQFSFGTNRQPQMARLKLKVKKYTYYQLVFESKQSAGTATITSADIQVRYSGNVK